MLDFLRRLLPSRTVLVVEATTAARIADHYPDKREAPLQRTPFIRELERLQQENKEAYRLMDAADERLTPFARSTRKALRTYIASANETDLEQMLLLRISQMDRDDVNQSFDEMMAFFRNYRDECRKNPDPSEY
jgi:hypothetical protein